MRSNFFLLYIPNVQHALYFLLLRIMLQFRQLNRKYKEHYAPFSHHITFLDPPPNYYYILN